MTLKSEFDNCVQLGDVLGVEKPSHLLTAQAGRAIIAAESLDVADTARTRTHQHHHGRATDTHVLFVELK